MTDCNTRLLRSLEDLKHSMTFPSFLFKFFYSNKIIKKKGITFSSDLSEYINLPRHNVIIIT